MNNEQSLARRVLIGTIIQPEDAPAPQPAKDIMLALDHSHKVINALLKERSGQKLTASEEQIINACVAAKIWQGNQNDNFITT